MMDLAKLYDTNHVRGFEKTPTGEHIVFLRDGRFSVSQIIRDHQGREREDVSVAGTLDGARQAYCGLPSSGFHYDLRALSVGFELRDLTRCEVRITRTGERGFVLFDVRPGDTRAEELRYSSDCGCGCIYGPRAFVFDFLRRRGFRIVDVAGSAESEKAISR